MPKYLFKPAPGRIAIKVENYESQHGLILVGDSHNPKPTVGTVWEVCDEYEQDGEDYDPLYKKGDVVIFGRFNGSTIQVDRDKFIVLRESEILARLIPSDSPEALEARHVKIQEPGISDDS